jgi:hypothetical protein
MCAAPSENWRCQSAIRIDNGAGRNARFCLLHDRTHRNDVYGSLNKPQSICECR